VFVIVLKVVELHVAVGEKTICASGTLSRYCTPLCVNEIAEFVRFTVAPLLGIPLAVKLALNQMKSPPSIGVPLKFEAFTDCAEQGGGGGGVHVRLEGENVITPYAGYSLPFPPVSWTVPENAKLPSSAGNEAVTVLLNVPDAGAVNGIEPMIGNPLEPGEASIS
jgi:hypothetical protein